MQKDIPYLRSGDRNSAQFTPTSPVEVPNPKAMISCAPSVDAEPNRSLGGENSEVGDTAVGGDVAVGEGGDVNDDGRDVVPPNVDALAEARSLEHMMTHRFKNPHCPSCTRCKIRQRPCRRIIVKDSLDKWGRLVTCDHVDSHARYNIWCGRRGGGICR